MEYDVARKLMTSPREYDALQVARCIVGHFVFPSRCEKQTQTSVKQHVSRVSNGGGDIIFVVWEQWQIEPNL